MRIKKSTHFAELEEYFAEQDFELANEEYETNPEFRAEVDKTTDTFIKKHYVNIKSFSYYKIQGLEKHHSLSHLDDLWNSLQKLTAISENHAREFADISNHTIADFRDIAGRAPVHKMGVANWKNFQLSLGIYFREIVLLSENLSEPWADAALSFQKRTGALRLLLQSAPDNLALVVSIDSNRKITLDNSNSAVLVPYDTDEIDQLRIGLFPFNR